MENSNKLLCYPSIDDKNLSGGTLIMPAISVGNIGQLAVDILLATLHAKRFTSFYHPSLVPLVGSDPLDAKSSELMTACDIYLPQDYSKSHSPQNQCNSRNFILMQIRSAISPNKSKEFLDDLLSWCVDVGICRGKIFSYFIGVHCIYITHFCFLLAVSCFIPLYFFSPTALQLFCRRKSGQSNNRKQVTIPREWCRGRSKRHI